jgi:tRNA(Ile)-lysidine synthase
MNIFVLNNLNAKISQNQHRMQQKVQTYIENHQLLTPNEPIIVGVSGGIDSVALLHILKSLGYSCIIAHCNFHLRMEESMRDEEFVRNLAHSYSIPFYSIDFKTNKYASDHKMSIEMAARDLRYRWFGELLEKTNAQAIAIAHHADDSIETMLMNLVRGTGLRGLVGIAPRNKKVVRPLLCCNRSEIENYVVEHQLEFVQDSSNTSNDYLRNRFRNEVLPLLIKINPTARENLYKSMEHLEENLAIYQQSIDQIQEQIVDKKDANITLNIELIKQQVHVDTLLYELLSPYGFNASQVEQIRQHLDSESGKIFYSETHRLIKDRRLLIITAKNQNEKERFVISQTDSAIEFPINLRINRQTVSPGFQVSQTTNCIHVDASKLVFPLTLRHWNEGDWFYPFGMNKKKKLSDFFIDNKLSLAEKEQSWLLLSGDDIVWIVGRRLDNRFRITEKTKEVIELEVWNQ